MNLETEKGVMSQGLHVAFKSWKRPGQIVLWSRGKEPSPLTPWFGPSERNFRPLIFINCKRTGVHCFKPLSL